MGNNLKLLNWEDGGGLEPMLAEVVAVRGGRWSHNGPLTGTTFIVQTTVVFDYLHKPPFIQTVSRAIGKTRLS